MALSLSAKRSGSAGRANTPDLFLLSPKRHDNPQPQEMILKGSTEGKTYIGPGPYPGIEDREVVPRSRAATASWCWRAVVPQRRLLEHLDAS